MSKSIIPAANNTDTGPSEQETAVFESTANLNEQVPTFTDLLPQALQPYWEIVQQYPIAEAASIFIIFWSLAYLIRRYAISGLRSLTTRTKSDLDDSIIEALRPPVFSTVIWFGLIVASKSAGFDEGVFKYLAPIASTMIVLGILKAALSISASVINALSRDDSKFQAFDVRTEPLMVISSKILILILAAYVTLIIWGINPVGLLASAGIVGIAVGFAAKDTLANLFSGVFILADRPYKLGDYVNLDGGERGKVTHIGIRSTRILTNDDIEVTIPNGVIGNAKVVNESGGSHPKMRIRLNVQCAYDANLDHVEQVLMDLAQSQDDLCDFPAPRVRVRGFGESGINIQLMGWIEEPKDRGRVTHLMYKEIHQTFRQENLEIPYPKRDINIVARAN
ncbi:hypothetical protein NBRC116583_15820 [Arenicella sp. 4NH20-0111]|uniref:mechanosensitive ion channel family protein n=1 Tax=Arenicella sp. 4NH20-0111 TaxID=3127648 RepID=UPI00310B8EDB